MAPVVVSTPTGLVAALKAASAGAVILLAPGRWEPVGISGVKSSGEITFRSQDSFHPAVLSGLTISSSEGLSFSNLTLASDLYNPPTSSYAPMPYKIEGSVRIKFDAVSIHGTLNGNPQDDVNGLLVQDSSQVVISNCEFQQLFNGIIEYRNIHISIIGNKFHDIRDDGIDNAGSGYVTISSNQFSDFYPVNLGPNGDHPDAIQFWTAGSKVPSHDIEIADNVFVRGQGSGVQGIFVTDQIGLAYKRISITGNTIIGSMPNGIMVMGCDGLTISGNTVRPYLDKMTWIRVEKCTDATVIRNRAWAYLFKNNGTLRDSRNERIFAVPPPTIRSPKP